MPFAVLFYAALSWLLLAHGLHPRTQLLGYGADSLQFVWFFRWWPYAVSHGLNPFYCRLIWQPLGVPMLWVTSAPLLALLFLPITLTLGAVPAVNACLLAAPVLSATAAFGLCRCLTRDVCASLIAGYLFGFSAYEMAADLATPNLSVACLVPLAAWLAVVRLRGRVGRRTAIALGAAILVAQFFIGIEIFATLILFGTFAWLIALALIPTHRPALRRLGGEAARAGAAALVALSPFLAMMARHAHAVSLPAFWPYFFASDVMNLFVPTRLNAFGRPFAGLSARLPGVLQEQGAYLGLPFFILLGLAAARPLPARKFLFACLGLAMLFSLGPVLWLGGVPVLAGLPWSLFLHLPLIAAALPCRFALYVSLAAATIAALWIAAPGRRAWRLALGLAACIALAPAPHPRLAVPDQPFFRPGNVARILGQGARVLILPFGGRGAVTYWQAESDFSFAQTGGYLGYPPAAMQHVAPVAALFAGTEPPGFAPALKTFLQATGTQAVLVAPGTPAPLAAIVAGFGWPRREDQRVTLYAVPHG